MITEDHQSDANALLPGRSTEAGATRRTVFAKLRWSGLSGCRHAADGANCHLYAGRWLGGWAGEL